MYEIVKEELELQGCQLAWSKREFLTFYQNTKTNIKIISSCGHLTYVQYNNFRYFSTGIVCKKCLSKSYKIKVPTDYILQEFKVIKSLEAYLEKDLDFIITYEGCLADFAIKPKGIDGPYLPFQLKTSSYNSPNGLHYFDIRNHYNNMYVMLFSILHQRIWILDGNDINVKKISIGAHTSVYDKFEVGTLNLSKILINLYETSASFHLPQKMINRPISKQVQVSLDFNEYRESMFKNMTFSYPMMPGRVYDVIINKRYKVQDKVITEYVGNVTKNPELKRSKPNWIVNLCRSNNLSYKLGDNDFYWLFLPDKKGCFIISELNLYEHGIFNIKDVQLTLHPYYDIPNTKNGWMNDHLYFFDNPADITRIYQLFSDFNKPEIAHEDIIEPIIITPKDVYNGIQKTFVHNLVKQIFSNVINNIQKEENKKEHLPKHNKICVDCSCSIGKHNKTGYCEMCHSKMLYNTGITRKVQRPSYEEIMQELSVSNYTQVGKKYGVSDNTIRKWIKMYEKHLS